MKKLPAKRKPSRLGRASQPYYWAMVLPGLLMVLLFEYGPMFGIAMAFQNFVPAKGIWGSKWVGLNHFKSIFSIPDIGEIVRNTLIMSFGKIFGTMLVALTFAIMLNEIRLRTLKKWTQTIVYLPHFLSWVIMAGIIRNILGSDGLLNALLDALGLEPLNFFGSNKLFRPMVIGTGIWKEFGYSSIVYLAALTSVDPGLHEAAAMDGASWWKRVWHITLPSILPVVLVVAAMNVGRILNAGFTQVYNLYNPLVFETGDIIDTYVYRVGLVDRRYSFGTAVGLTKSLIGLTLMVSMNEFCKKFANRRIF